MSVKYADVNEEYRRHEKLKKDDIKTLQEWMEKRQHLPKVNELKLIFFLQSCGFRLEPTKVCIENYFTIRSKCPEFFTNRTFQAIEAALESILIAVLPQHTENGYSVTVLKLLNSSVDNFHFSTHIKAIDMVVTLNSMLKGTAKGQIMIIDMDGANFAHLLKINLMQMKKYMVYLQEGVHARINGIHIVNTSSLTDKLLNLVKPLIKTELFESIHTHTKLDALYKYVPRKILPEEYGGEEASIYVMKEDIKKMVQENELYFEEEGKEVVDESKRQGTPVNIDGLFGIEGSFKKLDID